MDHLRPSPQRDGFPGHPSVGQRPERVRLPASCAHHLDRVCRSLPAADRAFTYTSATFLGDTTWTRASLGEFFLCARPRLFGRPTDPRIHQSLANLPGKEPKVPRPISHVSGSNQRLFVNLSSSNSLLFRPKQDQLSSRRRGVFQMWMDDSQFAMEHLQPLISSNGISTALSLACDCVRVAPQSFHQNSGVQGFPKSLTRSVLMSSPNHFGALSELTMLTCSRPGGQAHAYDGLLETWRGSEFYLPAASWNNKFRFRDTLPAPTVFTAAWSDVC